jgi:hypothetical protein
MNETAIIGTRSVEIARARSFQFDATNEKVFAIRAFIAITAVILAAWFLITG